MDQHKASALLGIGDRINTIEIQVHDVLAAEDLAREWGARLPDYQVKSWQESNASLLAALRSQSSSSYTIQVFVLLAVILGVASVLAISAVQKSKEIGILKAMGIEDKDSSLVFLFEGLILGIFGAIGGVLFGLGLAYSFTTFAIGADGNPVVPLNIDAGFIALSAGIAILASMLASLIPARKSSKLSVNEVIRNA